MTLAEKAQQITDELYYCYGSETGYLFGIKPSNRNAVRAVVKLVLQAVGWRDLEDEEKEGSG